MALKAAMDVGIFRVIIETDHSYPVHVVRPSTSWSYHQGNTGVIGAAFCSSSSLLMFHVPVIVVLMN
jgi:hypothetical protein